MSFLFILTFVVIEEEEVGTEALVGEELVEVAALLLGGAACATHATGKAADLAHLEDVVLFFGGDVLEHLGYELGTHTILDGLEHTKGVGDGRLAHTHHIALLDVLRGFHRHAVHRHLTLLAGIGSHRTSLIQAYSPKPFVYSCFHVL